MIEISNPNNGKIKRIKSDSIEVTNKKITQLKSNKRWTELSQKKRINTLNKFKRLLIKESQHLSHILSSETGKPLWESKTEVQAAIHKLDTTILAYQYRCSYPNKINQNHALETITKPLGLIAIIGPFNFPIHIPNGQILPALLTGNTVIVKSSEYTTKTTKAIENLWKLATTGIPTPIAFVYGDGTLGKHLVTHKDTNAIFFTGSTHAGKKIEHECHKLRKLCALEMGGNNTLIIEDASDAILNHLTIASFITAGQRCTCARRIIINKKHEHLIQKWIQHIKNLSIKSYPSKESPFMGPVVLPNIKQILLEKKFKSMTTLLKSTDLGPGGLITPRIEFGTPTFDNEIFGPMAIISLSHSLDESINMANNSEFGLSCSIYTSSKKKFKYAFQHIQSGIINWNTPTTGASGLAPFGGLKDSGNHRPGGFSMIDHCITPTASSQSNHIQHLHLGNENE